MRNHLRVGNGAKTYFTVYVPRRKTLRCQIIKHNVHFDRVAVKDFVDFSALQQVTKVSQSVEMLAV